MSDDSEEHGDRQAELLGALEDDDFDSMFRKLKRGGFIKK